MYITMTELTIIFRSSSGAFDDLNANFNFSDEKHKKGFYPETYDSTLYINDIVNAKFDEIIRNVRNKKVNDKGANRLTIIDYDVRNCIRIDNGGKIVGELTDRNSPLEVTYDGVIRVNLFISQSGKYIPEIILTTMNDTFEKLDILLNEFGVVLRETHDIYHGINIITDLSLSLKNYATNDVCEFALKPIN